MKKAILISTSIALSSLMVFSTAIFSSNAQTIGTASVDGVDIQATPANPAPGTSVVVSVVSYSTNLDAATISWNVNGKTLTQGVGLKSITVTAPNTGSSLQIIANIHTSDGADIEKTITITSGDVDMVWETSGYVPPFYKGKAPYTYQSTIKIVAVPHLVNSSGTPIDPKNLIYNWKQDSTAFANMSGYGKQSFSITGSVIDRPFVVTVDITSADGSAHAEGQLAVQAVSPSIVFYQDDPLYGVLYNEAIGGTLRLIHNQTKVVVAPYGFNIPGDSFTYDWSINGATQSALSASRSVILGVTPGQQGSSNVDLSIQSIGDDILQNAESSFTAVFAIQAQSSSTSNTTF
jgi:hypothetical protein